MVFFDKTSLNRGGISKGIPREKTRLFFTFGVVAEARNCICQAVGGFGKLSKSMMRYG